MGDDRTADRVLRRIREVLVILTLLGVLLGMALGYTALSALASRLGGASSPEPAVTWSCDPDVEAC